MPVTTYVANNNNFTLPSMVKKNIFKPNGEKVAFRKTRKNRKDRKNRKNRKNTRKN